MKLRLVRDIFGPTATLGRLEIIFDGETEARPFSFTCEDEDRGLEQTMSLDEIRKRKVIEETAIPLGTYKVGFTFSPKYQREMLLVHDVPGFQGIRIHAGNTERDTAGCILPGLDRDIPSMTVKRSTPAVRWLEGQVRDCEAQNERVILEIVKEPR